MYCIVVYEQTVQFVPYCSTGCLIVVGHSGTTCIIKLHLKFVETDFENERYRLWRETVPFLQRCCVQRGLDLVWADLHHGASSDNVHDAHVFNQNLIDIKECSQDCCETFFIVSIDEYMTVSPCL